MNNQYNFPADLLTKFSNLESFVQIIALFAFTLTTIGAFYFIKEICVRISDNIFLRMNAYKLAKKAIRNV